MSLEDKNTYFDFQDRIRELHSVLKSCEKHGVSEHSDRLKKTVSDMEDVLKKLDKTDKGMVL